MAHSPCAFRGNGRLLGAGRELISQGALRPSLSDLKACAFRKQIANLEFIAVRHCHKGTGLKMSFWVKGARLTMSAALPLLLLIATA